MNETKQALFKIEVFKMSEDWYFDIHMKGYRGQVELEASSGYRSKKSCIEAAEKFCNYLGVKYEIKCID